MKKSLVLAMAMALGVTASAYAANPFSDVPAGHWAYDSISKLAAAGVIEGYGDDTFRGDRLMTRYEMAQIVAKAMAKGANVDKLAAEFADELDALGVRVAALEKKADNVKITGNIRYHWRMGSSVGTAALPERDTKRGGHALRTRLFFNGQINNGWTYTGMLQQVQNFRNDANDGGANIQWQRAFIKGRIGGTKVTAGTYHDELVGGDSDVYSNRIDGIKLEYGNKVKLMGWYGKPTAATIWRGWTGAGAGNTNLRKHGGGIHLSGDLGKVNLFAGYDFLSNKNAVAAAAERDHKLLDVGAKARFGDVGLTAIYLHGSIDNDVATDKKNGWTFEITYKGAKPAKPGSWGLAAKYYDQGNLTFWSPGQFSTTAAIAPDEGGIGLLPDTQSGFKGFRIGGNYTFAKNMVGTVTYYDIKGKDAAARKARTIWTQMIFTF
ncbi:MAG: S-layer homology domain-containing protein [Acidaminococcaceae bacterium]|nr:S-layer homology domain-containing protein [Acidaminococcaceae bacterium]